MKITGQLYYLRRAIDQAGRVLALVVQPCQDKSLPSGFSVRGSRAYRRETRRVVVGTMYRIRLTGSQEQVLEQVFKRTPDRRLRARCQAVLMAARGRARHAIARDLGIHRTTVRLWL